MKKTLNFLLPIVLVALFFINPLKGLASELKFSVHTILPKNQVDKDHTYYDLLVKPEQEQTLKVTLKNSTKKNVTVVPSISRATTNLTGAVEYAKTDQKIDETLKNNLEDMLTFSKREYTIPAKSEKTISMKLKVPKEVFDGVIAGGITFKEKESGEQKEKKSDQGLAIENKFSYVVAVVLKENKKEVASELVLEDVEIGQVNARNAISATIHNTQAKFMNQLKVSATVKKKGDSEVLYRADKEGMQMAPNSNFSYPISLKGEKLKAGKYTLEMKAKSMGQTWNFKKDFEIKADEAEKLNKEDVTVNDDEEGPNLLIIGILILVALLIISLILVILSKKKNNKRRVKRR